MCTRCKVLQLKKNDNSAFHIQWKIFTWNVKYCNIPYLNAISIYVQIRSEFIRYQVGVPMPCMGRPARSPPSPPAPASQPAFKFKRFGVQFHKKIALAVLSFFLLRIFFLGQSLLQIQITVTSQTYSYYHTDHPFCEVIGW